MKQGRELYVISGTDSSSKFVFEIKNNPQKNCGKPTSIYPTNYDSFYMDRLSEDFDMDIGRNLGRDQNGATKILKYLGPKEKGDFGQLHAQNPKLEGTQKVQTADPDNSEYRLRNASSNENRLSILSELAIIPSDGKKLLQNQ